MKVSELARVLSVDVDDLRALNPALRPAVWSGRDMAPKGYVLRLPDGLGESVRRDWEYLPGSFRFERTQRTTWHRVSRGENLSLIAERLTRVDSFLVRGPSQLPLRRVA